MSSLCYLILQEKKKNDNERDWERTRCKKITNHPFIRTHSNDNQYIPATSADHQAAEEFLTSESSPTAAARITGTLELNFSHVTF